MVRNSEFSPYYGQSHCGEYSCENKYNKRIWIFEFAPKLWLIVNIFFSVTPILRILSTSANALQIAMNVANIWTELPTISNICSEYLATVLNAYKWADER